LNTRRLVLCGIASLPLFGWLAMLPILSIFPLYADEFQWKLINSRMLLEGGKLVYLLPVCKTGFLLDTPVSWYPSRLLDAALYGDMTNPQILRYWAITFFAVIVAYLSYVVRRIALPTVPYLAIAGALLLPFSLAVLPFLMVMNRPEQMLVVTMVIGCTLPLLLARREFGPLARWTLGALFVLLSWLAVAAHIKGLFLLPALLFAALVVVRQPLPMLAVVAGAAFGTYQTFSLWAVRTNCPESPFLMQVFGNLSLSPADLKNGLAEFYGKVIANIQGAYIYWERAGFQSQYQSKWLPSSATPLNWFERAINETLPLLVIIAALLVVLALLAEIARAVRERLWPRTGAIVAVLILAGTAGIAGFQVTKNFYESALLLPMLVLAVVVALPSLTNLFGRAAAGVVVAGALLAVISQAALILRFSAEVPAWRDPDVTREKSQAALHKVIDRCGIRNDSSTRAILMDEIAYTVLWRTREPMLIELTYGWWGTGVDHAKLIRDRKVSYAVGYCEFMPTSLREGAIAEDGVCCSKIGPVVPGP
jgi:hypothetical protein